ncbi:MAG TPA: ACT domain-containing protein, partial [Dehalococcoidia bacterium]|nr:ACT domain-containing protein [Dehalococcoidia bacterium]
VSISNNVYWPHSFRRESNVKPMPIERTESRYYLRIGVADEPGVLARVAGKLADRKISIASVIQKEVDGQAEAEIVIMTHNAVEAAMRRALDEIRTLAGVVEVEQMIRVRP